MTDPELFKYDVRIRERMLRRGLLSEVDLRRHLDGLPDVENNSEPVPQHQPALGTGEGDSGEEAS